MKEHFQDYGVRRWAGDDLVELQSEPLEAIQKLVEPYAPCIIQGCEVNATEKRIAPGMVALWELDENNRKKGVKIARFAGCVTGTFPVYLSLKRTPEERVYVDGKNKPIAYDYTAQNTTVENDVKDKFPLKITQDGGAHLPESLTVNFTAATTRENLQPKETLGTAFGKIRKWFSDLKAHAFRAITREDLDETLRNELDGKAASNHPHANASTSSAGFMSKDDKTKLDSLDIGLDGFSIYRIGYGLSGTTISNYPISTYFPSTVRNGRTLQVGDLFIEASSTSYLYRITAVNDTMWSATRLIPLRGEKGATGNTGEQGAEGLGIWRSSAFTSGATTSITLSTITIPAGRSVKVGDLIIANDTYSYLYRVTAVSSSAATVSYLTSLRGATGTAGTNATTTAVATTSAAGLMSAADKKKLDGAYIFYIARVQCSTDGANANQVYNPAGVKASFEVGKNSNGVAICKVSIGRPAGYTYVIPMILGESAGSAWVDGHTGTGSFNVYIMNGNNFGLITSATFNIVMIAHN